MTRRFAILALIALASVVGMTGTASAAQCNFGSGQLYVEFDTTGDRIGISRDGADILVANGGSPIGPNGDCRFPAAELSTLIIVHSGGTGQALFLSGSGSATLTLPTTTVPTGLDFVQLDYDVASTGAVSIPAPITLGGPATLTSAGAMSVGAINPGASFVTTAALTLTGAPVTVTGAIGGTYPMASLDVTSTTAPFEPGGSITTTGTQSYGGAGIRITAARTLTASSVTASGGISSTGTPALTISQTGDSQISGQITDGLSLTKAGAGTLTLYANNTYTGSTTVSAGVLDVINNNGLGATSAGTSVATGATLRFRLGIIPWEPVSLADGSTLATATPNAGTDSVVLNGTIALAGTPTIAVPVRSTLVATGVVSGSGYAKTGTGTLTVEGANTHTGAIAVDAGTLRARYEVTALGTAAAGTTVASGATLEIGDLVSASAQVAEPLTLNGGGVGAAGALVSTERAKTMTGGVALATATTIGTSANLTISGAMTGTPMLTKAGTATLALSGGNAGRSGITQVSSGTLEAASATALGTGAVLLDGGSTLQVANVTLPAGNTITTTGSGEAVLAATGTAQIDGPITLGTSLSIEPAASATLRIEGSIDSLAANQHDLVVDGAAGSTARLGGPVGQALAPARFTTGVSGTTVIGAHVTTGTRQDLLGTVRVAADVTLSTPLLGGSASIASTGALRTLTADVTDVSIFTGTFGATVELVKVGPGEFTITSDNSAAAPMRVDSGILSVQQGGVLPAVTAAGGLLNGDGAVGAITRAGGVVGPIWPRRLTTGSIGGTGSMLDFGTLATGTAGMDYGQLRVLGTVNLTGAILYVDGEQQAAPGRYMLIDNDGADPVVGTFLGLAEGEHPMTWPEWTISYVGGDGNDVVITRTAPPSTPASTTGSGAPATPTGATTRATTIAKATAKRRSVRVTIDAGSAGTAQVRVTGRGSKTCTRSRTAAAAGAITLTCRVKGRATHVVVRTTFTPTGAAVVTRTDRLRLKR